MKKESILNIIWVLLLLFGIAVACKIDKKAHEILIFLFTYVSLMYVFFLAMRNNIVKDKPMKILILEEFDKDELLQMRLNTELENLRVIGFTTVDVKIIPIKKFIKVFYKAYILYY
ncbi:hypothetical protein [Clostridium botulinum]|uniref:hypothetical protein n=1 Tax=Clostridium botulinum TaxID=1491 RepID=UPI000947478E|nr:hypothetical protein [Clostridium botulinum]APQ76743.1 hypothetical protein RSJ10_2378 [Clostridium botulinum]MBN3353989.1 hypothetical protein [Clostridium botulinum]QDY29390.1 hypothetical protein CGQ41_11500 [Clostridium botulinum]